MTLAQRDALLSRLSGQRWPFAPLLDVADVPIQARVLDIGGGAGGLLAELERRGHLGPRELVDVLHGSDAHALPFPEASVDVVFMVRVLAHLDDPSLALIEARRVLAPGGRLMIAANGPDHLAGVLPRYAGAACEWLGTGGTPFEVVLPIRLSEGDQQTIAAMYGQDVRSAGELSTCLHLAGRIITVTVRPLRLCIASEAGWQGVQNVRAIGVVNHPCARQAQRRAHPHRFLKKVGRHAPTIKAAPHNVHIDGVSLNRRYPKNAPHRRPV